MYRLYLLVLPQCKAMDQSNHYMVVEKQRSAFEPQASLVGGDFKNNNQYAAERDLKHF